MNKHSPSRRSFLKHLGLGALLAGPIAATFGRILSAEAATPAKAEMVDPKSPQAQALGYTTDAKKVDTKKWPKKAGPDGKKQACHTCQFYQAPAGTDPAKTASAPCQIFGGKVVKSGAWCNSWTKHA